MRRRSSRASLWYNSGMDRTRLKRIVRRGLGATLGLVVGVPIVVLAILPYLAPYVPIPEFTFDLAEKLPRDAASLLTNTTVTARVKLATSPRGGLLVFSRGRLFGWPYELKAELDYSILTLSGDVGVDFAVEGSALRVSASARATPLTWRASATIPEATITEEDALLGAVLAKLDLGEIDELKIGAMLSAEARAEKTRELPVPVWAAKARVARGSASCRKGETPFAIEGLSFVASAEGIADRVTIGPLNPRLKEANLAGISISNVSASIRATERGLYVNEASAAFCGGEVKLYSLFLNPASMTAGFTLFLDDLDAEQLMHRIKGFKGEASGRLHGKLPLFLKNGEELRLKNAYLYSTPGETGSIRVTDPAPILDNLAMSGVDAATCENLGKALADLLYSVLKIELKRDADGSLALGLKIEGTATHGKTTVPVSFSVTFHGDLEQLINTSLRLTTKKGKK